MAKADHLGIRLESDEKCALEAAAKADDRLISALARKILLDWMRQHGWLASTNGTREAPKEVDHAG